MISVSCFRVGKTALSSGLDQLLTSTMTANPTAELVTYPLQLIIHCILFYFVFIVVSHKI